MKRFNEKGEFKVFSKVNLVRMAKAEGEIIPKHSHPTENIVFTCTKGKVQMTLDGRVEIVSQGETLTFDGDCEISGVFLEASELVVTLIEK